MVNIRSYNSESTGLAWAALMGWKLTIIKADIEDIAPAMMKMAKRLFVTLSY